MLDWYIFMAILQGCDEMCLNSHQKAMAKETSIQLFALKAISMVLLFVPYVFDQTMQFGTNKHKRRF